MIISKKKKKTDNNKTNYFYANFKKYLFRKTQ